MEKYTLLPVFKVNGMFISPLTIAKAIGSGLKYKFVKFNLQFIYNITIKISK